MGSRGHYSFYDKVGRVLRRDVFCSLDTAHAIGQGLANRHGQRVDYAPSREIAAYTGHHSEETPGYSAEPEAEADGFDSANTYDDWRQP